MNTENLEPMEHVISIKNVMREDETAPLFNREDILNNAPLEEDKFFKVPKI